MHNVWPLQSKAHEYYSHTETSLVSLRFPYRVTYDGSPVTKYRAHARCATSLSRVLETIQAHYVALHGKSAAYDVMELDGVTIYDGSYCDRAMRGNPKLRSMHAYGCAIDFDAEHNLRGGHGRFQNSSIIVQAFKSESWIWGGDWHGASCDPMHFQAARVG
jgi:hypothetical protein